MRSRVLLLLLACTLITFGCSRQRASEQPKQDSTQASDSSAKDANQQQDHEKARNTGEQIGEKAREAEIRTRDERAKIKQGAVVAGEKLKQGTIVLAQKTKATAQGISEGWKTGNMVDLNSASREKLTEAGLSDADANNVIAHRPYQSKEELLQRKVISPASYRGIQDRVAIRHHK
jgi:DNA uptake protein ComE-like DNA-binding protein